MLLIQTDLLWWGKGKRNIEGARDRSKRPTAWTIKGSAIPEFGECWINGERALEWEEKECVLAGPVEVVRDGEVVRVYLNNHRWTTEPEQGHPLEVKLGQTAQVFLQLRATGHDDSWFERKVANVAWLERFDPEVFRLRPFDHELRYWSPLAP